MQDLRSPKHPRLRPVEGFTLLELMIVVVIISVFALYAAPSFEGYSRRMDARMHARKIAQSLDRARTLAMQDGNNYLVLFDSGAPGQLRIVDDDNNDWLVNSGENTSDVVWNNVHADVSSYGSSGSPPAGNSVPEDGGGPIPSSGTTLSTDSNTGLPAVGFTPRGIPVALDTPTDWASGAGSYYVTDGNEQIYAVTLLPFGGVRARAWRPATGDWY